MASAEDRLKLVRDNLQWLSKNSTRLSKQDAELLKNASSSFEAFDKSMNDEIEFGERSDNSKQHIPFDATSDSERI